MSLNHVSAIGLTVMLLLTGCMESDDLEKDDLDLTTAKESDDNILGCTYASADNFQSNATVDDGSCSFEDALEGEYDEGYADGFSDGYDDGLMNGYSDGYDDGYWEGSYDGYWEGYDNGLMDGGYGSTLDAILDRGYMMCGVKNSQYGMGYQEEDGTYSGLDIEYCRAIAAAIGLNPDTDIEYVLATGSNRFELLAYGEIDVLIRTTTWTASRDADLDADYAAINFYDGQGLIVRSDAFAYANGSATELDGANICVGTGTTSEGNLDDWFMTNGISFTSISVDDHWESMEMLKDGSCDAYTGDMSAMIAMKWEIENDSDWTSSNDYSELWIATELMAKEPLAAATRDYDTEWNEIVSWVWYGMLTAEELGIDSTNYEEAAAECGGGEEDILVCRLLTVNFGLGTDENQLSMTWMQSVLATTGNYYEAYDRAFCDGDGTMTNCLMDRAGTANAPWWEGGLQYAPPMR